MYNWKLPHVNSSLNGCIIFNWNSDVLWFFKMKTWRVQYDFENVFFPTPNPMRCKYFKSKSDAYWNFQFKILPFKKALKMQNMSFSRSKKNQNVIFWMQTFFQNLTRPIFSNSKSNTLYFFQSKTLHFVKLFNRSLTCFDFFFKIWRVRKIEFKIWQLLSFFSPKSDIYLVFQVLTEWWLLLSTLITTYFKEENWTTMSVIDLVARCTTGSCHPSFSLSMFVYFVNETLTCCVFF